MPRRVSGAKYAIHYCLVAEFGISVSHLKKNVDIGGNIMPSVNNVVSLICCIMCRVNVEREARQLSSMYRSSQVLSLAALQHSV